MAARTDWKRLPGDRPIYFIERPKLTEGYQKPETPLAGRTEQVFVNGRLLRQAPDFAMLKPRGVFYVNDTEKRLYVCLEDGKDPNKEHTEVTGRTYAIAIGGSENGYRAESILRDPDRFDFTLTDVETARKMGFDPEGLRLDWSEYYQAEETTARTRQKRDYTPFHPPITAQFVMLSDAELVSSNSPVEPPSPSCSVTGLPGSSIVSDPPVIVRSAAACRCRCPCSTGRPCSRRSRIRRNTGT